MQHNTIITITSMLCITALVTIALCRGIDGILLATAIALLSGLGGYTAGVRKKKPNAQAQSAPHPKISNNKPT